MSKFNAGTVRARSKSPLMTEETPSGKTYEGHPGYARDTKSELFLLAVSNFVGENTFYEKAKDRDGRFRELIGKATIEDPQWTAQFLLWLRSEGNMRTASLVGAAEYVKAAVAHGITGSRKVVNSVLQRADEPGEILAYWTSNYGRKLPAPLKRGIADAILELGTEFNYLKWNSEGRGYRFADLLNLTHPGDREGSLQQIRGDWQHDLFSYIVKAPHQEGLAIPESLATLTRRKALMAMPVNERRDALDPLLLKQAGMTWESLAGWLQGPMDAKAWESIIPNMGTMALIRNLRNFDQAGVSDKVAEQVCQRISDPDKVVASRQLPYRWFSAYREVQNDRWRVALGRALEQAVHNIPALPGRTLILIDTSGSMSSMGYSERSKMTPVMAAALFGVALAYRCGNKNVDLVGYADGQFQVELSAGGSVLRYVEDFTRLIGRVGHGTQTAQAVRATYAGHDRVVILTDEQAFDGGWQGNVSDQAPKNIPIYAFNLGGYKNGMLPGETNRHQLGSLTDHTFRMIPLLEAGRDGSFPWEDNKAA